MDRPLKGIAVDGSTRGNPGPSEYKGVDITTGRVIFHVGIDVATNNITEFIGLCHAIFLCAKSKEKVDIYTDSMTALSWVKKRVSNSTLIPGRNTQKAIDYLNRVEAGLKELDVKVAGSDELIINGHISVLKWYTSEWGEIRADFGHKA
jgi:ribonuclease HI